MLNKFSNFTPPPSAQQKENEEKQRVKELVKERMEEREMEDLIKLQEAHLPPEKWVFSAELFIYFFGLLKYFY